MTTHEAATPFGRWLIKECQRMIDPNTGKPITWRQASLQAGLDHSALSRFIHGTHPTSESVYKLAMFFSTPERRINPDYLLYVSGLRLEPAPEFITSPTEEEDLDTLLRREAPWLYDRLAHNLLGKSREEREAIYKKAEHLLSLFFGDET